MTTQPEALRLADALDSGIAGSLVQNAAAAELRRQHEEIERLNNALTYEQHLASRIGTHGPGCNAWGPAHYECAVREIERLKVENAAIGSLMNAYNLGGWTDSLTLLQERDKAHEALRVALEALESIQRMGYTDVGDKIMVDETITKIKETL